MEKSRSNCFSDTIKNAAGEGIKTGGIAFWAALVAEVLKEEK